MVVNILVILKWNRKEVNNMIMERNFEDKNICVCTKTYSKEFDTFEELLKWTEREIEKNKRIVVDDLVEVVDTGQCYSEISDDSLSDFYMNSTINISTYTNIINNLNHKSLGYSLGIESIDKKVCTFKVIAEIDDKYVIQAVSGSDVYRYNKGYYIIGKKGVKKCLEI